MRWLISLMALLLLMSPALALELRTDRPPDSLLGRQGDFGISGQEGSRALMHWDLNRRIPLGLLTDSACKGAMQAIAVNTVPSDRHLSVQRGEKLYQWCPGEGQLNVWDIVSGQRLRRIRLDAGPGLVFSPFGYDELSYDLKSSGKWALIPGVQQAVWLYDRQRRSLGHLPVSRVPDRVWMTDRELILHIDQRLERYSLPDLSLIARWKLPEKKSVGLLGDRLVTWTPQPLCRGKTPADPVACAKSRRVQGLIVSFRSLSDGALLNQVTVENPSGFIMTNGQIQEGPWNELVFHMQGDTVWLRDQAVLIGIPADPGQPQRRVPLPPGQNNVEMGADWAVSASEDQRCIIDLSTGRWLNCQASEQALYQAMGIQHGLLWLGYENHTRFYRLPDLMPLAWAPQSDAGFESFCRFGLEGCGSSWENASHQQAWNDHYFAVAGESDKLGLYDLDSGALRYSFGLKLSDRLELLGHDRLLMISDDPLQPMIQLYQLPEMKRLAEFDGHAGPISKHALDYPYLLTADDHELRWWNLETRQLLKRIETPDCEPEDLELQSSSVLYVCSQGQPDRLNNGEYVQADRAMRVLLFERDQEELTLLFETRKADTRYAYQVQWDGLWLMLGQTAVYRRDTAAVADIQDETVAWKTPWQVIGRSPYLVLYRRLNVHEGEIQIQTGLGPGAKIWNFISQGWFEVERVSDIELVRQEPGQLKLSVEVSTVNSILPAYGWSIDLKRGHFDPALPAPESLWRPGRPEPSTWRQTRDAEGRTVLSHARWHKRWSFENVERLFVLSEQLAFVTYAKGKAELVDLETGKRLKMPRGSYDNVEIQAGRLLFEFHDFDAPDSSYSSGFQIWDLEKQGMLARQVGYWHAEAQVPPGLALVQLPTRPFLIHRIFAPRQSRYRFIRVADGSVAAGYLIVRGHEGLLFVTEEGYYAGVGDYQELAWLKDGDKALSLKDFPEFHRPDLVWQVLQGQPLKDVPRMPGLQWEETP